MLSPDSTLRDRREKAATYARVSGLQAYLVVDPDSPRVEVHLAEGDPGCGAHGPGMRVPLEEAEVDLDGLHDYVDSFA